MISQIETNIFLTYDEKRIENPQMKAQQIRESLIQSLSRTMLFQKRILVLDFFFSEDLVAQRVSWSNLDGTIALIGRMVSMC